MDFNSFLSWDILATFAGVAACTGLLTQMLKSVTAKLPTQRLSYIIAVLLPVIIYRGHGRLDAALDGMGVGATESGLGQPGKQMARIQALVRARGNGDGSKA